MNELLKFFAGAATACVFMWVLGTVGVGVYGLFRKQKNKSSVEKEPDFPKHLTN